MPGSTTATASASKSSRPDSESSLCRQDLGGAARLRRRHGAPWHLPLAQIEQAAILLATARLQPSIPMSVVMLRRDAAASWRVIVRKPYDGWD